MVRQQIVHSPGGKLDIYGQIIFSHFIYGGGKETGNTASIVFAVQTSIDVVPSKNQAMCEYYTHVIKLKDC